VWVHTAGPASERDEYIAAVVAGGDVGARRQPPNDLAACAHVQLLPSIGGVAAPAELLKHCRIDLRAQRLASPSKAAVSTG